MDDLTQAPAPVTTEAPPSAPASAPPSAPTGSAPGDFELKWNGRTERVPVDRARELAQMGYDYTQKTQQLAREREQFLSERSQYQQGLQELRDFLADDAKLEQYLNDLRRQRGGGRPGLQPSDDPSDVLTREQAETLFRQREAAMSQQQQQAMQALHQKIQVDQLAANYRNELDGEITRLKSATRELQTIPRVEKLLRDEVRDMRPQSIEEAKQMLQTVASQFAQQIRQSNLDARKDPATNLAPAALQGIEPGGGAGVSAPGAPAAFKSVKDPAFKAAVMADVLRLTGANDGI